MGSPEPRPWKSPPTARSSPRLGPGRRLNAPAGDRIEGRSLWSIRAPSRRNCPGVRRRAASGRTPGLLEGRGGGEVCCAIHRSFGGQGRRAPRWVPEDRPAGQPGVDREKRELGGGTVGGNLNTRESFCSHQNPKSISEDDPAAIIKIMMTMVASTISSWPLQPA